MKPALCPACSAIVTRALSDRTTLLGCSPHVDAEGREHFHDANRKTRTYQCACGQWFEVVFYPRCWCGWTQQKPDIGPLPAKIFATEDA